MNANNNEPRTGDGEQRIEDRIDTVLAGIRHAEPTPGMEQRITAVLLRQADAASQARPRWPWLRMPQIAGVAAIVAAALLVSVRVHRQTAVASPTGRAAVEKAAGFSPLNLAHAHEGLQPRTAFTGANAPSQTQHVSGLKAAAFSGNATAATNERRGPRTREASQPVEQANGEQGFPAPPLPLTEQERLLIRLVHRDDPVQLAQMTPAAREAGLQRDHAQVREFFKAPPMLAANFKLEPYPTSGGTQ